MPFTGAPLDRATLQRKDSGWVARQLRDPSARAVVASADGLLVSAAGPPALARVPLTCVRAARGHDGAAGRGHDGAAGRGHDGAAGPDQAILLGLEDGAPRFALDLDALSDDRRAAALDGRRLMTLRELAAVLEHSEAGLAAYAAALLNWHRRSRFCPGCGALTSILEAGAARHCGACGQDHFPRTDPVVIMTVEHAGRLLLGRRAGWPAGRMSVLAGFVAPGESAEEAVAREVMEEAGIAVRRPVFVESQPWPFPASLMLGFHALADGGEPAALDGELAEVGWYDRAQVAVAASWSDAAQGAPAAASQALATAARDAPLRLPPRFSVARRLIDRWLAL
ncbi:MAG TPA: NAD(+) diphosphatase [Solirubrobacteraceae bacterium]|nr:NAD(+) diphosphatase [Solirubrobacteraceae bacterium]